MCMTLWEWVEWNGNVLSVKWLQIAPRSLPHQCSWAGIRNVPSCGFLWFPTAQTNHHLETTGCHRKRSAVANQVFIQHFQFRHTWSEVVYLLLLEFKVQVVGVAPGRYQYCTNYDNYWNSFPKPWDNSIVIIQVYFVDDGYRRRFNIEISSLS